MAQMVKEDKLKALDAALGQIEKQFGKGAIMKLGENKHMAIDVCSSGSLSLDIALGVGGYPRGRIVEIYGPESSGKTTFAAAAKEFSQDPGSANQGGDLGWAPPDIFDPAFRDALTRLNKGQMSAPVHSSFGWHLIELLDTRNVDKTDAAQKDRAYRMLMNRKFSEEAASWMQEQRASAYVKILSN